MVSHGFEVVRTDFVIHSTGNNISLVFFARGLQQMKALELLPGRAAVQARSGGLQVHRRHGGWDRQTRATCLAEVLYVLLLRTPACTGLIKFMGCKKERPGF